MKSFSINLKILSTLTLTLCIFISVQLHGIDWSKPMFVGNYPISNYDQSKPESAFGCVFAKEISVRVVQNTLVAVNKFKIDTINAEPGAGPFASVAHTYAVDFNKDGYADMIAITYDAKVFVKRNTMPNTGNINFDDKTSYIIPSISNGEGSLVVDDFDNDGKIDLFFYSSKKSSNKAAFIKDATENPVITVESISIDSKFSTNWTVSAMASFDFDKDGFKDIIYADMSGRVWFWKNDPTKGNRRFFTTSQIYLLFSDSEIGTTASEGAAVLDIADLNGDGIPDIVAGNTDKRGIFIYYGEKVNDQIKYDPSKKVAIVKTDGDLGSAAMVDGSIPNSKNPKSLPSFAPTIIKVTDVDRDGYPDIFVGTDAWRQNANFGGSIYLFRGKDRDSTGKPRFVSLELVRGSYSSENKPPFDFDAGTIGDLDNDGIPDFVAADGNNSGNFYKIVTKTVKKYEIKPGILVSDKLTNVVDYKLQDGTVVKGIPRSVLQNHFVQAMEVELEFTKDGQGTVELRYSKTYINRPELIDPNNFPRMLDPVQITSAQTVKARAVLETPSPDPQIIIVLKPANENTAPHLKRITYRIWTAPARVEIKGFRWLKSEF
ncbi:FG-GAP repeat domain-containing protein [Fervidobacterium islandicum]|uniref:FG-GAP repeat domain-containing protein n=1 Tax=Fervidobacterium islandicum TaxID=2423 RepID=UPI003A6AF4BA